MGDGLIGRRLGNRYEVREKVGEGGMAVVYLARDTLLDRQVAVKVLRDQFAADDEFVARFRLEAQAAASLTHPNVVNIYDVGEDGGVHYIVMEYVEGETLKERIQKGPPVSIRRAVGIAIEIARALEAAERRHLVHRDIKPHNILITSEGSVKVTDFGIARAASSATLTQTGTVIGSVHYFSPEQARGEPVDTASDIYSLGILLYELLTGRLPFTGENPVAVALKHVREEAPPLSAFNPGVPPVLERIVGRMMAKERESRYRDAAELLRDLRRTLPHLPLEGGERESAEDEEATQVIPVVEPPEASGVEQTLVRRGGVDEIMARAKKRKKTGRGRWLIVLVLLSSFMGGVLWAAQKLPDLIFPEEVRVPDVRGLELSAARARLAEAGLRIGGEIIEEYSREVEAGRVIRQEPEADRRVRMGREIRITLSLGHRFVVVPDLIGRPRIDAELQITQEGLTLGQVSEEYNPNVPPNTVIRQEPPANTRIEEGRPVDIVLARGSQPQAKVVVPDVFGLDLEEAKRRLEAAGLRPGDLHAEPHPTARENQVIDQFPAPGDTVDVGFEYKLIYAQARPAGAGPAPSGAAVEDKNWEETILIEVPEGPAQEVVVAVRDDFGVRQVMREVLPGGSRRQHTVKVRGDSVRIWVWFDGLPQTDKTITRPGGDR